MRGDRERGVRFEFSAMKISLSDPRLNLDPTPVEIEELLKSWSPRRRALFWRASSALKGLDEPKKSELGLLITERFGGAVTEADYDELEALLAAYAPMQ
jgi:hypothetical protein